MIKSQDQYVTTKVTMSLSVIINRLSFFLKQFSEAGTFLLLQVGNTNSTVPKDYIVFRTLKTVDTFNLNTFQAE